MSLKEPIVEGACPFCGKNDGLRAGYLVPTDPADVVAELRERSESEWYSDELAPRAYREAADIVAEKLGIKP